NAFANFAFRRFRIVVEQVDGGHDHAGRAEAALQSVLRPETFLQRMQLSVFAEAFDRRDLRTVGLNGQYGAGFYASAIHQHGARAALARIAPDVRARESELFAEVVNEEQPCVDGVRA